MTAEVGSLLDAFDLLVASCRDLVSPEEAEAAARVGRTARRRLGYLGRSIVVALAGGTGSGKSSLLNALAEEEVAPVSPRRPTTERPVAWIPANPEPGLTRLLDDLGIDDRIGHDRDPWLAVVDLPDFDSMAEGHRIRVDELLPRVDAVVWVLDPEKYQDARLHLDYLAPLVAEQERFIFVLNRIDRVPRDDLDAVVADLTASLRVAGFGDPTVLCTAADPDAGPPEGVDELASELGGRWEAKELVWGNVVRALDRSARELAAAAGADGGTGFRRRWNEVLDHAVESLADGMADAGSGSAVTAIDLVETLITDVAAEAGGDVADELAPVAAAVGDEVFDAVRVVEADVSIPPPPTSAVGVGLRAVQVAAGLLAGAGLYGVVQALRRGGGVMVAVAIVVLGGVASALAGTVARRLRERRWRRARDDVREAVADRLRRELDRRIGRRVRDVLRRRAEGGAAYAAFRMALTEAVRERPPAARRAPERRPAEATTRGAPRRPG